MPPKGDPLTAEEIKILSLWIAAGAKTETTIAQLGEDPGIEVAALAVEALHLSEEEGVETTSIALTSVWDTLSPDEQKQRMDDIAVAADKYHFSVMPISAEDDRLRINVINAAKEFGDDQVKMLEPVADRIAWLDLARSQVTDEGLAVIGKMNGLERLHLENTNVTEAGIAKLESMPKLEYLNLYGTKVGNGVFESFQKMPLLRKVYLWQTNVDAGEAKAYERSVNLEINTGVDLTTAAPAKPAEPEKKEPAEAEKKPEPKPKPKPATKPAPKAAGKAKAGAKKPEAAPKTPASKPATDNPKETPKAPGGKKKA
jgi:hypothetical protein